MLTPRISKDLIRCGLDAGLITFSMRFDNLAANLADRWFYISEDYHKTEKDYTRDELVDLIYEAVNDEPINAENEDDAYECLYYKWYLENTMPYKVVARQHYEIINVKTDAKVYDTKDSVKAKQIANKLNKGLLSLQQLYHDANYGTSTSRKESDHHE